MVGLRPLKIWCEITSHSLFLCLAYHFHLSAPVEPSNHDFTLDRMWCFFSIFIFTRWAGNRHVSCDFHLKKSVFNLHGYRIIVRALQKHARWIQTCLLFFAARLSFSASIFPHSHVCRDISYKHFSLSLARNVYTLIWSLQLQISSANCPLVIVYWIKALLR